MNNLLSLPHLQQQYKKYVKRYLFLILAVVFIVILAAAYGFGYRVGPGITLARVGTITLTNLPKGTSIIADQTLREVTSSAGNATEDLVAGNHTIIVGAPDYYPWSNVVSISSGKATTRNPILVHMKPDATPFASTSAEYATAFSVIASSTLPTVTNPLKLMNGCVLVYVADNRIIANAAPTTPGCTPPPYLCTNGTCDPTIVFAPIRPLNRVLAFPGHQDALVVEFDKTLYALALDPRSPQFFAPILTGTDPIAASLPDGTIVVRNGNVIYKLKL